MLTDPFIGDMDNQRPRRWEVKDSAVSGWRSLPGELTPKEIWDMRLSGDFWVAMPVREDDPARAALRLAMTLLIQATGGTAAADVRVARMDLGNGLLYAALVPLEYRANVHHYLAEQTDLSMPLDGYALILNSDQALEVMGLAYGAGRRAPRANDASRP